MGDGSSSIMNLQGFKIRGKVIWIIFQIILTILFVVSVIPLPNPLFQKPYVTTLYGSNGELLSASIAEDEQWRFPPSDSIPKRVEVALLLLEDEHFFRHPGVNPFALTRAIVQNVKAGEVISGGSTITMQTIRMAMGNKPRTYLQKSVEILSSLKAELLLSKYEILQNYVDNAPFGGNIVGIQAAAWRYYGRDVSMLSWAEVATLVSLPNNPATVFPGKNNEILLFRRNRLLEKISRRGYLDDSELFLAKEESIPNRWLPIPDLAYHLLHRGRKQGHEGQKIISTLDTKLQKKAKQQTDTYSQSLANNQIHNAASLIVDIESGEVKAYVGNTNNPGDHGSHVDVITSQRSPGSLLKPFLYALALDEGLIAPKQLLPDIPLFHKGFAPSNFDKKFRGAIHADDALISSLNVPFVHLLKEYGIEKFHQKLNHIGFKSINQPADHYGLSIILGGAETTLWELSNAFSGMYRAMKNYTRRPLNKGYTKLDYDKNHFITQKRESNSKQLENDGIIRAPSIGLTLSAMSQLNRPFEETGWEMFNSSQKISWKTGTSFGFRDGWAVGLNGKHLVAVWIGNADGEGRPGLTGVSAAAPLMFQLFDLLENHSPEPQVFGESVEVCFESGMISTSKCLRTKETSFPNYLMNTRACTYHRTIHLDNEEKYQVNSSCYPINKIRTKSWFVLPPVQSWYYQKYHPNYQKLPAFKAECNEASKQPLFDLVYPGPTTKVIVPLEQDGILGKVIFEAAHEDSESVIYWHLDKEYVGSTTGKHQIGVQPLSGSHLLTLIDNSGNQVQQEFSVIN